MLKSITVENYRSFRTEAKLQFRPLTILLGKNSSGKSSLTRLIPLLQQSLERQSSSPLLWSSDSVDLGNISDVVTHSGVGSELRIGIRVVAPHFHNFSRRMRYTFLQSFDEAHAEFEYIMRLSAEGIRTKFNGIEIRYGDQTLEVDWDQAGQLTALRIDKRNYELGGAAYSVDTKSLFPEISRVVVKEEIARSSRGPVFYEPIRGALAGIIHGRTAAEKIDFFARSIPFLPRKRAREALLSFPNVVQKKLTDESVRLISNLSMINDLPQMIRYLSFVVEPIFLGSAYIGPSRASGKRFARLQELAVDRLDSSGENTAMYVYSLNEEERRSFNDLLVRACGHTISVEESGPGHVSVKIGRQGQNQFENIADVGFGFSQLVPVIAQLHAVRERNPNGDFFGAGEALFAVEQPELHLHPAMQSNLADLFVGAVTSGSKGGRSTKILVETHSETLVSQLGVLIAEKQVSQDDIAIYFVNKDEITGQSNLQEVKFNEDGVILDWPSGFFSAL
ncbi:AAA family ATPase [Azospirillum agricola]|uniref:AAA family ATPase n=1 Tax=Azospirillum agricola TaxID=1720247 RepID=UPI000A0EF4B9|nr:DUF3696 domain-containing protein [Azospirillum agricola]SMH52382.1 Protein of unknown function [Azospirillum lipoferum]